MRGETNQHGLGGPTGSFNNRCVHLKAENLLQITIKQLQKEDLSPAAFVPHVYKSILVFSFYTFVFCCLYFSFYDPMIYCCVRLF